MRKTVCLLLSLVLTLSCALALAEVKKEEVVYAKLSASGEPLSVYVVNAFETDEAATVTDYGEYAAVLNLSDDRALSPVDTALTLDLAPGRFYYQGALQNTQLPWTFALSYALDGAPVSPEALSGASGDLAITLSVSRNERDTTGLFDALSLQITLTLDGDRCMNVQAPLGTVASAGKNKTIAFVALPGMEAEYQVTARVTDFAMQGAQIAAVQMTMDTSMYVQAFTGRMAEGPMKTSMASVVENMLLALQGQGAPSFASDRNAPPAAVQFVMMTEGVEALATQKEAPVLTDAPNMGLIDRIKALFD